MSHFTLLIDKIDKKLGTCVLVPSPHDRRKKQFHCKLSIKLRPVQCRHSSNGGQTQWSISWPPIGWLSATSRLLLVHTAQFRVLGLGLVSAARPRHGTWTLDTAAAIPEWSLLSYLHPRCCRLQSLLSRNFLIPVSLVGPH